VLDTHANKAFGDGDCVLGHELLEGDEEPSLDGNAARYGGMSVACQYIAMLEYWESYSMAPDPVTK
jgi:hypothetical protein